MKIIATAIVVVALIICGCERKSMDHPDAALLRHIENCPICLEPPRKGGGDGLCPEGQELFFRLADELGAAAASDHASVRKENK